MVCINVTLNRHAGSMFTQRSPRFKSSGKAVYVCPSSVPVAQPDRATDLIEERFFARVFTGLRTVADARCLGHVRFAPRCAELRSFAVKNCRAIENDRGKVTFSSAATFGS
jgi:hypothetical protein